MYLGGFMAQVLNLSCRATEEDVYDFFSHCGSISHIEILRSDEEDCTAFVTFLDAYSLETAVLLSGARIVDQCVCVVRLEESGDDNLVSVYANQFAQTPGEAITVAQQVVKTMLVKGYDLGKDALVKAKALDEAYQLSSLAAGKIVDLSSRVGLTDKINVGMEAARNIEDKYNVSHYTKQVASLTGTAALSAATFTGQTAASAAISFRNSSFFAKGALWVSDLLLRASHAAAELANKNTK